MKESELHAETMLQNLVRLGSDGKWDTKVYNNNYYYTFDNTQKLIGKWQFGNS